MKFSVLMLLSILLLLLPGCSSKPTVYVYAKYLDDNERNKLTNNLTKEGLDVKSNEFDFPSTVTSNTVLYSLLLQEPDAIDKTSEIADTLGFPIHSVQMLTQGNHWYTKNSLALFLLPEGGRPDGTLLSRIAPGTLWVGALLACLLSLDRIFQLDFEDGTLDQFVTDRYAGWQGASAQDMLNGKLSLESIAEKVEAEDINPRPRSGRQEYLENVVNRFV